MILEFKTLEELEKDLFTEENSRVSMWNGAIIHTETKQVDNIYLRKNMLNGKLYAMNPRSENPIDFSEKHLFAHSEWVFGDGPLYRDMSREETIIRRVEFLDPKPEVK